MGQSSVGFNPVFAAIRVKTFTYKEMLFPLWKVTARLKPNENCFGL